MCIEQEFRIAKAAGWAEGGGRHIRPTCSLGIEEHDHNNIDD